MCLDNKMKPVDKKEWLANHGETVTAYKVVKKRFGMYYPCCISRFDRFAKKNRIPTSVKIKSIPVPFEGFPSQNTTYKPYFHLFVSRNEARRWAYGEDFSILKCIVPVKAITEVGTQCGGQVIITKEFSFVASSGCFDGMPDEKIWKD